MTRKRGRETPRLAATAPQVDPSLGINQIQTTLPAWTTVSVCVRYHENNIAESRLLSPLMTVVSLF